jgi:hypothetical protein
MKLTQKLLGLTLAAAVGFASQVRADDTPSGSKKSLEARIHDLESKLKDAGGGGVKGSGIKVSGYVDTSYILNLSDRDNNGTAGPAGGGVAGSSNRNSGRVFDNQFDAFALNAFKLTIEKDKDSSKYPAGFRVDTIIGEDATVLKAAKGAGALNFDSDLYLEQAYVNLGIPLGNGIDVKVGKMVTLVGYEPIESPANWQFSRSDAFALAPLTQTGITLGYKWNDWITTTVGAVNGFDSLTGAAASSGSINYNTDFSFVGRADITGPKTDFGDFAAWVSGFYGNDDTSATTSNNDDLSIWGVGVSWDKPFKVKPLTLAIDYLYRNDHLSTGGANATVGGLAGTSGGASVDASAVSAYAKWDWNKWLTSSARFSYSVYRNGASAAGANVGLGPLAVPASGFNPSTTDNMSFTLTQAFNVWKDTLVRLEWRHDWTDTPHSGFGSPNPTAATAPDDIRQHQDTIAVNVVYSF